MEPQAWHEEKTWPPLYRRRITMLAVSVATSTCVSFLAVYFFIAVTKFPTRWQHIHIKT